MRSEAAVARIASEQWRVAKILGIGAAIGAGAAGVPEPRHADAPADACGMDPEPDRFNDADDLVSRHKGQFRMF